MKYPKTVKLYHMGTWYHAFDDDAKIVSFLLDFKLYEGRINNTLEIGFPESSIDKVETNLRKNKVNYILVNDDRKQIDFRDENNYDKFLYNDLPISYVRGSKNINIPPNGTFVVKYNDEPDEEFIIGQDGINENTELVKSVLNHNVGETFDINGNSVILIKKDIFFQ